MSNKQHLPSSSGQNDSSILVETIPWLRCRRALPPSLRLGYNEDRKATPKRVHRLFGDRAHWAQTFTPGGVQLRPRTAAPALPSRLPCLP